jgi:hypothetical protein
MKHLILSLILYFTLFSCNRNVHKESITIHVWSSADSSELGFFSISIFKKGFQVKDTFANLEGYFTFHEKKDIEGIIIKSAGYFPAFIKMEKIEADSIIFLKTSDILIRTGGVGIDTALLNVGAQLERKREKWNKQYNR